jgi:hypothetical protein
MVFTGVAFSEAPPAPSARVTINASAALCFTLFLWSFSIGYFPNIHLTRRVYGGHHVTVPRHDPLRIGTLAVILDAVSVYRGLTRDELLARLYE